MGPQSDRAFNVARLMIFDLDLQRPVSRLLIALALTASLVTCGPPRPEPLRVFAAASLSDVLHEIAEEFSEATGVEVDLNLAGSNVLAQQIGAAASEGVFLSANPDWVAHLEQSGATAGESFSFASNQLVLIANSSSGISLTSAGGLFEADFRYLALADPNGVPAGRYARSWLMQTRVAGSDLWSHLQDRVAPANDVRGALALVESSRDVLGVVYRTDAITSKRIKVLLEIPRDRHDPIDYRAVAVSPSNDATAAAGAFLQFLREPRAQGILSAHGFEAR